ncbi:MAG: DUF896 domain-containing protein [Clostridia bacterium]|nr:DUF896 domain-containing protein [Clostridia bacterium]
MDSRRLERINELAVKGKTEGLTVEEKAEREALRFEYISELRENLRSQLDSTVIKYPDGRTVRLSDKKKK